MGKGHSSPEYMKIWRENNRKHVNEYNRNYQKHKEKRKDYQKEYRKTHKKELNDYKSNYKRKIRNEILELLGNKCIRCGFSDIRILQIDHVKGCGKKEIQSFKTYTTYLRYVLKKIQSGSKDYQLLCPNHNWLKRIENKKENNRI